jgi:hypothetical protein
MSATRTSNPRSAGIRVGDRASSPARRWTRRRRFLRCVLSQEEQAGVMCDGKYLPLTADMVREQLKKLE